MKTRYPLLQATGLAALFLLFLVSGSTRLFAQSAQHKPVVGTHYSIIPPEGFETAKNVSGFQNKKREASIMLTELPASVQSVIASFSGLSMEAKGMKLLDKQDIEFDTLVAALLTVKQSADNKDYLKQIFLFGDQKRVTMVIGTYPEAEKKIGEAIKAALLSVKYNEGQEANPFDVISFKLTVNPDFFKLAMTYPGSVVYTVDGNIRSKYVLFTASEHFGKIPAAERKEFALAKLRKAPGAAEYEVKLISPVRIDNLQGYEAMASGKNEKDQDESVYQVVLFDDSGKYYTMTGIASDDIQVSISRFKTMAYTFKRK